MSVDDKHSTGAPDRKDEPKKARPKFYRTEFGNTATEDETHASLERIDLGLAQAGLGDSRFVHHMYMNFNHQIATTDIETMATMMFADGDKVFMQNPHFTNALETTADVLFVEYHEALHPFLGHLRDNDHWPKNQTMTYACEIVINAIILARLGTGRMPHTVRTNKAGNVVAEPTGIDPREVYHKTYLPGCTEAGLTPVSYDRFTESELACYTELMRLPDPPGSASNQVEITCAHGEDESDEHGGTLSDELMDEAVKAAIQATVTDARQGSKDAKEEILRLAAATEDGNEKAQKMWGNYGIMGLRGKTDATRKVTWWLQWLHGALASKLVAGDKLMFPKKRTGMLMALGEMPVPVRRGDEMQSRLAVFEDTSGSMSQEDLDAINSLVGAIPGAEVDFYMFDGVVARLIPGESVMGGGGTNFQNCVDVAEGRLAVDGEFADEYDVIIMVTDGYAAHVTPAEPDKWIWLITQGGDDWPDAHQPPMECHIIDTVAEAASA